MQKYISLKNFTICFFILSFYLFSRFTVDDSFINWMNGKNFVNFGIWNYNVTSLDLSQAYTSLFMSILSIIPNYLQVDIVLFFKILSIISLFIFVRFGLKIKINNIPVLLLFFLSLPASIIHLFSGMETFYFAIFLTMIYVSLYNENSFNSFIYTSIAILIRPEAWALIFIPLYFLATVEMSSKRINLSSLKIKIIKKNILQVSVYFLTLLSFVVVLLYVNTNYFGHPFPTAAYKKIGSVVRIEQFLYFSFFCLPLIVLIIHKKIKLFIFLLGFLLAVCFVYAKSTLIMNYHERFLFHIFAPIVFFLIYLSINTKKEALNFSNKFILIEKLNLKKVIYLILIPFIGLYFYKSSIQLPTTYSYYPRLLNAYKVMGDFIHKNNNEVGEYNSISVGDAGILPYNANVNSLDSLQLGSSYVTHQGIDDKIIDIYNPKLIFLHAYAEYDGSFINKRSKNLDKIKQWAKNKNYYYVCNLVFSKLYVLEVYSFKNDSNIREICALSEKNNISNLNFLKGTIFNPPWKYWHH